MSESTNLDLIFARVKKASRTISSITEQRRSELLLTLADEITANSASLLEANSRDLSRMERENPLYDRLQLTPERLESIASDMRHVASLPSPSER